ncbi:MAG: CP family cyanate transporter-like MFS transporter, partial [Nonlabens sp.]
AFMGLQSTLFFVTLTWLPDVLIERGMTDLRAGAMVSVLNVGGLLGVLIAPAVAGRRADQRWYGAASGALTVVGIALLLPAGIALAPIGSLVFGLGAGSTIGLALTFMSLRTATARDAAALSGMAQTWGYLVSAAGPLAWGALRELSGSWTMPLVLLLAVALATTAAGYLAGRDRMLVLPADP